MRVGASSLAILLVFVPLILCAKPAFAAVWYVDAGTSASAPTGTSWGDAYPRIQQGIDAAFDDGGGEVWIAGGYYIESGILNMRNGVDVYGGFAGAETTRAQRDWLLHTVTIDGSSADNGSSVSHVVTGANARLDGVTIRGGNDLGLKNKQFIDVGGGLLIFNVSCVVANCTFIDNVGGNGGAIYISSTASTLIENCLFYSNTAFENGGAIFVDNDGTAGTIAIRNCFVRNNHAGLHGGGLYLSYGDVQLQNNVVVENRAIEGAGGGVYSVENPGSIINCTISDNQSVEPGAGLFNVLTEATMPVINCIIWANLSLDLESAIADPANALDVRYSCVGGGFPGTGNINEDPLFAVGEVILYSLTQDSPCIDAGDPAGVPPAPAADIEGVTRPQGARVDMGAFEHVSTGEGEGEGEPFDATLTVHVIDAKTEQGIGHAVVRLEPQGLLSERPDNASHVFHVQGPAAYQLFITATGYTPATRDVVIDAPTESVQIALSPDPNGSADSDGDGLTDSDESTRFATNPNNPDTDGDGISDLFEVQFSLDPLLPNEGTDADGDRLSDLEEFLHQSDPNNPNDPRTIFFVSPQSGPEGNGTAGQPFRSISGAIDALDNQVNADNPAALLLLPGTFHELVVLQPGFELYDAAPPLESAVQGTITGAANTVLSGISVYEADDKDGGDPLIVYSDGNARLRDLFVQGFEQSTATGARFTGNAVDTVSIRDCVFDGFTAGIDVVNVLPSILRTQVYNGQNGIVFRVTKQSQADDNTLGDATDANSGWNRFSGQSGHAAVNERSETIKMENIDWDTDNSEQVDNLIEGPADFEPFLAKGAGLLPSSITCVVWDAGTRTRITNASATISPGGYSPVTENVNGVYTFAAIPAAQYTVRVEAAGYPAREQAILVEAGAGENLIFAMNGGDDPGVCGCTKAYNASPPRKEIAAGNALLALATALLTLRPRRR